MSENTNTPNGVSKDLYINNQDVEKFTVGFMEFEEKGIFNVKNNDSDNPGSNTTVAPNDVGEISGEDIKRVGYVGIQLNTLTPEIKKTIENRAEKSEESYKSNKGIEEESNIREDSEDRE